MFRIETFTDAPLNFYRGVLLFGCSEGVSKVLLHVSSTAASLLYFLFSSFSLFLLCLVSSPCLLFLCPLVILRGDFLVYQHTLFPHNGSDCVLLLLFPSSHLSLPHTNFTVSHIKTCTMALRVSFLGLNVAATKVQFCQPEKSHIL